MFWAINNEQPDDQVKFMIKYLEDKFGERAFIGDKSNLEFVRKEVERLETLQKQLQDKQKTAGTTDDNQAPERNSESETDSDNSDDYVDVLPEQINKKRGPRQSVSAEAFGQFNKKQDFKARVVHKSE